MKDMISHSSFRCSYSQCTKSGVLPAQTHGQARQNAVSTAYPQVEEDMGTEA